MASRCVFSTAVAYALSKVGKEGLVLKKEQLQTIRNLQNILSLLDSCTEQFYGTCTEIFHACANSVYQALSLLFWEGPGYEANDSAVGPQGTIKQKNFLTHCYIRRCISGHTYTPLGHAR